VYPSVGPPQTTRTYSVLAVKLGGVPKLYVYQAKEVVKDVKTSSV
jgi:hypothetical protein